MNQLRIVLILVMSLVVASPKSAHALTRRETFQKLFDEKKAKGAKIAAAANKKDAEAGGQ